MRALGMICTAVCTPERANLTPPPRRLMSQVGEGVAQHARLQSHNQTWAMLPEPNRGADA
eukprot:6839249-Prymnesium_polylepis.1